MSSDKKSYPPLSETSPSRRVGMVREIFATVTGRYDFLNRLLSLRRDVAWRRFTARKMVFKKHGRFLDVATGTADLAIEAARCHPGVQVAGLDFVPEMLDAARSKIESGGLFGRIGLVLGDALFLPFPDESFDVTACAFGIRNMPDRSAALREMARVTVPGGRVMILEMTTPRRPIIRGIYTFYLTRVLPRLAAPFSANPAAYRYLADSIMAFPSPQKFAAVMEQAGLTGVAMHPLTLGAAWLHVGVKPPRWPVV